LRKPRQCDVVRSPYDDLPAARVDRRAGVHRDSWPFHYFHWRSPSR
jgi:hypothetical protein